MFLDSWHLGPLFVDVHQLGMTTFQNASPTQPAGMFIILTEALIAESGRSSSLYAAAAVVGP